MKVLLRIEGERRNMPLPSGSLFVDAIPDIFEIEFEANVTDTESLSREITNHLNQISSGDCRVTKYEAWVFFSEGAWDEPFSPQKLFAEKDMVRSKDKSRILQPQIYIRLVSDDDPQ